MPSGPDPGEVFAGPDIAPPTMRPGVLTRLTAAACILLLSLPARAGGPRWTAGAAYFNASVAGQPLLWANGTLVYYTDQGALSSYVSNTAAASLVAAAAAPWTQIATASVTISPGGQLAEDVNGSNVSGSPGHVIWPADVESTAVPVPIIYDEDGSILNTVLGAGASDPSACLTNAVSSISDGFSVAGYLTHAIIILNGLCATNAEQVTNMQYLLTREFGRVLGLDWSQANDNVFTGSPQATEGDYEGWPLMHPINLDCGGDSYSCIPDAMALRMDDRAALGRLYPGAKFSKETVRIHGTISFADGQGMQGVLVQAIRLVKGTTTPDTSMVASCISGFAFRGNAGNVVTGTVDAEGNPLARFGSSSSPLEGEYDLAGLELPSGAASADYELTFTAINPLYTGGQSVGPMLLGTPAPSGTLATIIVRGLTAGANQAMNIDVTTSATAGAAMGGSFAAPTQVPASGTWNAWINGYGDTDWMSVPARANRQFSVIAVAKNEAGGQTQQKAMPLIGAWFADDPPSSAPDFATSQAFDSSREGTTVLTVQTPAGDGAPDYPFVLAIADARGDGRPDYAYTGRVLYADSVSPAVVPVAGGILAISGMGFVPGDQVLINGDAATVLSLTARQIVAQAPANIAGDVDVTVTDPTGAQAIMPGALTFGPTSVESLETVTVPGANGPSSGAVAAQAPGAFTVIVVDSDGNPVPRANVTFSSALGSQLSACSGASSCTVQASTGGIASTYITPTQAGTDTLTASLADGASAQGQWTAVATSEAVQFTNAPLFVVAGQAISWPVSVTAVANGSSMADTSVSFTVTQNSKTLAGSATTTNSVGTATFAAPLPALTAGSGVQVTACLQDNNCATTAATAESPEWPVAVPIAGALQTVLSTQMLAPLQLQIFDGSINASSGTSNPFAGLAVTFQQTLLSYEQRTTSGKEPPAKILAQSTQTITSDVNGLIMLQPLQQPGTAGSVVITASAVDHVLGQFMLYMVPSDGMPANRASHETRNPWRNR